MSRWPLLFWALVMIALSCLMGYRLYQQSHRPVEVRLPPQRSEPPPGILVAPFELTERSGDTFRSESLQGQVWVVSFFFTKCPGACLQLNNAIASIRDELKDTPVTFVSITVDPATDTPDVLRKYAEHYAADSARWLFLTGSLEAIRDLAEHSFQVSVERVTHSDRLILIGRDGHVQGTYRGTDPQEVARLKRKLTQLSGETT